MTDNFATQYPYNYPIKGCFVVRNIITNSNKTIRIFDYPIPVGTTRDLLRIPGVSESSIRASLLKGELRNKILAGEIHVLCSDIDLLQFNGVNKQFLQAAGVINGLQVGSDQINVLRKEDIQLIGSVNDVNVTYTIPDGVFLYDSTYKIIVYKNGVKQVLGDDYTIFEGGGPGTGYNGILFTTPPSIMLTPIDVLTADYYITNI